MRHHVYVVGDVVKNLSGEIVGRVHGKSIVDLKGNTIGRVGVGDLVELNPGASAQSMSVTFADHFAKADGELNKKY